LRREVFMGTYEFLIGRKWSGLVKKFPEKITRKNNLQMPRNDKEKSLLTPRKKSQNYFP
jgi:hypothetical protein